MNDDTADVTNLCRRPHDVRRMTAVIPCDVITVGMTSQSLNVAARCRRDTVNVLALSRMSVFYTSYCKLIFKLEELHTL